MKCYLVASLKIGISCSDGSPKMFTKVWHKTYKLIILKHVKGTS